MLSSPTARVNLIELQVDCSESERVLIEESQKKTCLL
jgi:hypothetical protein